MNFKLSEDEKVVLLDWKHKHDQVCKFTNGTPQGAIGGRTTYQFTPTGLGTIASVLCACGAEHTLSNFDDW